MKKVTLLIGFVIIIAITIAIFLCLQNNINNNNAKEDYNKAKENSKNKKKEKEPVVKDDIKTFKITAAGDCTIGWDTNFGYGSRLDHIFELNNNDYNYFYKNVKSIFEDDDLTYVNLEGTFTNHNVKVEKRFNFKAPPHYVNVLKEGNVEVVGVANNHSYDYGKIGYDETIETLKNNNVDYFGYDNYLVKEVNGLKIGFFGVMDIDAKKYSEVDKGINYLKEQNCDLIIAAMHWGIEKDYVQNERQVKLGHYMIDNGVDLVLGTHPHVIQGIEKYKDRYIVYSLANFLFGGNSNPSDKDTFIYQQTFTFKNGELQLDDNVKIIPTSVSSIKKSNNYQPTPLTDSEAERVLNKILKHSTNFTYNL